MEETNISNASDFVIENGVLKRYVGRGGDVVIPDGVIRIRPAEESGYGRFDLEFAKDEDNRCVISLFPETGTIRMDRTYSGFRHDVITTREFYADFSGGEIRLRLILDRYSAELFVGEGEQASSMVIYTPESVDGICMKSDRPVLVDMEKYDIRISSQEPDNDNN